MRRMIKSIFGVLTLVTVVAVGCGSDGAHGGSGGPAAPTNLAVAEMEGGAHLTWKDNSDNEASFMIERKGGTSAYQTLATVPFNTTQYHDPNLAAGTTYGYRVMAMGKTAGKDSTYSNEVTFMLPAGGAGGDGGAGGGGGAHDSGH